MESSRKLFDRATVVLPGGSSSSFRGYPVFKPHPIFMDRAKGSKIYDIDGKEYVDYLTAFGSIILGHCHPKVNEAVKNQIDKGTMLGTAYKLEVETAEKVAKMVPNVEMLSFCCSGTEATMTALRIARACTGKDKIIKFEGHYHGHHDYVCVSSQPHQSSWGSRWAPNKIPMSPGVPSDTLNTVIVQPWNDIEVLEKTIERRGGEIAAVLMEPLMGNGGMIYPEKGYLEGVRELTQENDIVLIFDEVVTGFRLAKGGASEYFKVKPDLHCFSKSIANGYPIGAFGGKREIMSRVVQEGVFHAGTYSANPLCVAAVHATLSELDEGDKYKRFYEIGNRLTDGLREVAENADQNIFIPGFAGFFNMYFTDKKEFHNWRDVGPNINYDKWDRFAWQMIKRGVYLHPDATERINITISHTEDDVERTLSVAKDAFRAI